MSFGWRRRTSESVAQRGKFLHETHYLVSSGDDSPFFVQIEPEAMSYEFPPHERVLLLFRGQRSIQHMTLTHYADAIVITRPGDCEVWASLSDGSFEQIAGWAGIEAPWLDSGHDAYGRPPWSWPPPPEDLKLGLGRGR